MAARERLCLDPPKCPGAIREALCTQEQRAIGRGFEEGVRERMKVRAGKRLSRTSQKMHPAITISFKEPSGRE